MKNTAPSDLLNYRRLRLSNGINVAYADEGEGEQTILFVHGLGTYGATWALNIAELKKNYRCIAIDLPGNGFSEAATEAYGMQFFAVCLYDFVRLLKLRNVVLCGHSMGGQVALTLALHAPDLCRKMILCAPAGLEEFNIFERSMYHSFLGFSGMFRQGTSSLRSSIHSSFYKNPHQADGLIADIIRTIKMHSEGAYQNMADACVRAMLDESVYSRLRELKPETLVIFGDQDALIPNKIIHPESTQSLAERAVRKMPHAQLVMVSSAGHFVQWEKAGEVNAAIKKFLGSGK